MSEIVSTDKWLLMLATELEMKGFPPAYGPYLRHAAEILGNAEKQLFEIDAANMQLHDTMAEKDRDFKALRAEANILWSRYQKAIDIVKPYEPQTAAAMEAYRPRFLEII